MLQRLPSTTSTPSGMNLIALSPGNANALTLSPLAINCLQTCPHKNPAAPVTKYNVLLMILPLLLNDYFIIHYSMQLSVLLFSHVLSLLFFCKLDKPFLSLEYQQGRL